MSFSKAKIGTAKIGTANISNDGISIAEKDKMVMQIQDQQDCKKKQLKEDYARLKKSVKDNPYLQVAIDEYEKYFAIEKQQVKALKDLLKHVDSIHDQREIKKAIIKLSL